MFSHLKRLPAPRHRQLGNLFPANNENLGTHCRCLATDSLQQMSSVRGNEWELVLAKNPNIWEESMQRALNEAHRFFARDMLDIDEHGNIVPNEEGKDVRAGNERSRAAGRQLAEIRPIFAKVRDFYDARGEFDTEDGLPRGEGHSYVCLLYTSPSPRDRTRSRMPSSA